MEEAALRQEEQGLVTVLFAGIASAQQLRDLGHASSVQAVREGLDTIQRIASERGTVAKRTESSMVACFQVPAEAVKAAIRMQRSVTDSRGAATSIAVRIALHCAQGFVHGGAIHGDIAVFAAEATHIAKPGRIYVSSAVRSMTEGLKAVGFHPVPVDQAILPGHSSFYEILWYPETDCSPGPPGSTVGGASTIFVHGAALLEGAHAPCFYCGSRKHRTTYCPSKQLPYGTDGLERLGRMSVDEMNSVFSRYLAQSGEDLPAPQEAGTEDPSFVAPWSFYELKRHFQLRFLSIVWAASPKDDWYRMKESKRENSATGGLLWLARDCIKMSDLDEAENLLTRYARQAWKDYRTACGLGFIKVERGGYTEAADLFREAMSQDTNPVQKTYLSLLLSRIYELTDNPGKSLEALKEALRTEPYCLEALFEATLRNFQLKQRSDGIAGLRKLLHVAPEYYTPVLISPELTEHDRLVRPELERVARDVRKASLKASKEAEEAVAVLRVLVGEGDTDLADVLSMQKQVASMVEKPEAFLHCHEAFHLAKRVCAACAALEEERRGRVERIVDDLDARAKALALARAGTGRTVSLARPVTDRLRLVRGALERKEPFSRCLELCVECSRTLDSLEAAARRARERAALIRAWASFLKDLTFVLFVTAATGLVLLPGAFDCLNALRPGTLSADLQPAQKTILVAGSLFALVFSLGRAAFGKGRAQKGPSRR